jgi:hypothetical protein
MKPGTDYNAIAMIQAGYTAACLNLGIEFTDVSLSRNHQGIVASLTRQMNEELWGGVLTPEQESRSTNLAIIAFAGPALLTLRKGRRTFDITTFHDLDDVLDMIELRFANNDVRMAFTRYCEAEAFALFEDDQRLWRFANLLAKELAAQQKLTYEQCLDLYNKEYVVESWVRKELEEIVHAQEPTEEQGPEAAEDVLPPPKKEILPLPQEPERRPHKRRRGRGRRAKTQPPVEEAIPLKLAEPLKATEPPKTTEPLKAEEPNPSKKQKAAKKQKSVPVQAAPVPDAIGKTAEKPREQKQAELKAVKKPKAVAKRSAPGKGAGNRK